MSFNEIKIATSHVVIVSSKYSEFVIASAHLVNIVFWYLIKKTVILWRTIHFSLIINIFIAKIMSLFSFSSIYIRRKCRNVKTFEFLFLMDLHILSVYGKYLFDTNFVATPEQKLMNRISWNFTFSWNLT